MVCSLCYNECRTPPLDLFEKVSRCTLEIFVLGLSSRRWGRSRVGCTCMMAHTGWHIPICASAPTLCTSSVVQSRLTDIPFLCLPGLRMLGIMLVAGVDSPHPNETEGGFYVSEDGEQQRRQRFGHTFSFYRSPRYRSTGWAKHLFSKEPPSTIVTPADGPCA